MDVKMREHNGKKRYSRIDLLSFDNQLVKSRRSQVTIFVIIGLIIVVTIILAIGLINNFNKDVRVLEDPTQYIETCIKERLEQAETRVLENNFYVLENNTNAIIYQGLKIPYLCKVSEFYVGCMPQEPMLFARATNEIEAIITPQVEACFDTLVGSYKKQNYEIEEGEMDLQVLIKKGKIQGFIEKKITLKKQETVINFNDFNRELDSPLYDLIDAARNIVNYESTFCEFNYINYMLYNPKIKISKFSASDQTKIYTIKDRDTKKEINIAVKTCALPAGI
jgi:hypothetical protein